MSAGTIYRLLCLGAITIVCSRAASFSKCDVNQDGQTTIADAQLIVNEVLGAGAATNDLNGDGKVNVVDAQIVINAVIGLGCSVDNGSTTISDFNPKSGPIGTSVTITGNNFGSSPLVSMPKQGGGTIGQPLSSVSATSITFAVAAGSATGPLTVTVGSSPVSTATSFTVSPSTNFSVAASPPAANLIMGQSVSYSVQLSSTDGFAQLASLGVTGLPNGVTASFAPQSITAGQTSVLTLTAPANQPASAGNSLSISAAATVNGLPVSPIATVSLAVVGPTTSLLGRTTAADNMETPLTGVSINSVGQDGNGGATGCSGQTAVSDGAGNFALTNLPMNCTGLQLFSFNGSTVTSPAGKYSGVQLVFSIVQGQVTVSPINVHLPRIDTAETFYVQQDASSDQTYSYSTIPGLKVVVYAHTTITMSDGTQPNPYPLAGIQVPADRLPDVKAQVPTMMMALIVAFQPENSTASQPIAVYFPNELNTPPGTDAALITLDPQRGTMVPYGTGMVSPDGSQVIPDADPAHPGHLFGLLRPGWHFFAPPPPNTPPPPPPPPNSPDFCPPAGDPVFLDAGMDILEHADLDMPGGPFDLMIIRALYSGSTFFGPFGYGGEHNFDYTIDTGASNTASVFNLVIPFGARHLPYVRQPDGTLINTVDPRYAGTYFTTNPDNSSVLWFPDGSTYQFSAAGFMVGITDRNRNSTTILRNSQGEVSQVSDNFGRQLTFTYGILHPPLITSIQDSAGRMVNYTYDAGFHLTSFTDANGGVWNYTWDPQSGSFASVTDPRGVIVEQNTYDSNNRVKSQVQADGSTIQFAYTYYNPTNPTYSPILSTTVTDQLGRQTVYRFNPLGYIIQITDPLGQVKNYNRAPGTSLLLSITGTGACPFPCSDTTKGDTFFTYDARGNMLTWADSLGNTFTYTYDPKFNQVTSIIDPNGALTQYQYDNHGNLTGVIDPDGNSTTITIGTYGLPAGVTDPAKQTTTFQYDNSGNLTAIVDPTGGITAIAYDNLFRPTGVTTPSGAQSFRGWDQLNHVVHETDGNGGVTTMTYDPAGNLLSVTDPRGSQASFTYDSLSRVIKRTDGLGRQEQFQYDAVGNLTSHTDRRGQTAQFNYDTYNRLTVETYPDSSVSRAYDAYSRLIQVNDSVAGSFAYQYDTAGRLLSSVTPTGAVAYTRDADGRVTSRQASGFPKVSLQYDSAGNLTQSGMPQASVNLTYDARNLLSGLSRSNGVSTSITRDPLARVLSLAEQAGNNTLASFQYGYNPDGNPSSAAGTPAQALTTAATTGTFNLANEMLGFGGGTFTYDANGNRLTAKGQSGTTNFTWDGRNRLRSIAQPSGTTTQFTYDYGGNLIQQAVTAAGATATTSYLLDNVTNVVAISPAGGTPLSVLTGNAPDQHFATIDSAGRAEFSLPDAIGSVVGTSGSSATLDGSNLFEPFGQTTSSGVSFPFAFAGRPPFASNSAYYFRSRFYDPAAGRYLSEDTSLFGSDPNRYRYSNNSPLLPPNPFGSSPHRDLFGGLQAWLTQHLAIAQQRQFRGDWSWMNGRIW